MGHLDRLLPKDGTSWLAHGPNYTQDIQSHTQWATWLKMGHLDKLLPKDGTSWLAQGPNYTQDLQSHIHTQWPPDERSSWQYAAEYWDIQTSTRTQLHNKIHNHTHTQWATWRRWVILTGCCQMMGHPDYHNYPITHKIHNRTQLPPDERWTGCMLYDKGYDILASTKI